MGLAAGLVLIAGCDSIDATGPGGGNRDPRNLDGFYEWLLEGFDGVRPYGIGVVELTWELPTRYDGEVFRVYGRRSSSGSYRLIATVTSCAEGVCRYQDPNIFEGGSYDYYVASVDERDGTEEGTSAAIRIEVPSRPTLATPGSPVTVALDNAVYVTWGSSGARSYRVLVTEDGGQRFAIGETDGLGFLDTRAENGSAYTYHVASVDEWGHVSDLVATAAAYPRPDYYSELVFVDADNPGASGFRFVDSETLDPIVAGDSPAAQWRLETASGTFMIRPLGQTTVTQGIFTTMLTCGPGSDDDCEDVREAPPSSEFGGGAVPVSAGNTHVFRVVGPDNRVHYAKLRVQGTVTDGQGRRLMVFDWAYQLRPDETSLDLIR